MVLHCLEARHGAETVPPPVASLLFEHTDPGTLRTFHVTAAIRHTEFGLSRRYFLIEFLPSGQYMDDHGSPEDAPMLLMLEASEGPNNFLRAAARAGVEPSRIVLVGVGAQAGRGFERLDEAVAAIDACIACNRRYSAFDALEERDARRIARQRQAESPPSTLACDIEAWAARLG